MEEQAKETPFEELREEALKHYEEISSRACHWNSFVPAAIKAYNPQFKAATPVKEDEDCIEAGNILYPLELQMVVLDFIAWLESVINLVKKSYHPQIKEKIEKLKEYQFKAAPQANEAEIKQKLAEYFNRTIFNEETKKHVVTFNAFNTDEQSIAEKVLELVKQ